MPASAQTAKRDNRINIMQALGVQFLGSMQAAAMRAIYELALLLGPGWAELQRA